MRLLTPFDGFIGVRRPCRGDFVGEEAARGLLATVRGIGHSKVLL